MVSYRGQPEISKRVGWPGSLPNCVAGSLFQMDVFEADASAIKSLMSGTYITIRKTNCQVLRLHIYMHLPLRS